MIIVALLHLDLKHGLNFLLISSSDQEAPTTLAVAVIMITFVCLRPKNRTPNVITWDILALWLFLISGPRSDNSTGGGGLVLLLKCEIYSKPCLLHPGFADTRVIKLPPLTSLLLRRSLFLGRLPARKIERNTTPPKGLMLIRTIIIRWRGGCQIMAMKHWRIVLRTVSQFRCNSTFIFKALLFCLLSFEIWYSCFVAEK